MIIKPRMGVASRQSNFAVHNDDFPTPPWATRAFFKYVVPGLLLIKPRPTVLDPACGRGHMVNALREFGFKTKAYDNWRYNSAHQLADYANGGAYGSYDIMFTNPPYRLADEFAARALTEAKLGVAMLVRTMWLEGSGRQLGLFKPTPPTRVTVFSKRMQATHGRVIRSGSAMMSHAWFWWDLRGPLKTTELTWLPPTAQRELELPGDYDNEDLPVSTVAPAAAVPPADN